MTPNVPLLPNDTEQWREGYKAGYEAGKSALNYELKKLLKELKEKEPYGTTTATYTLEV